MAEIYDLIVIGTGSVGSSTGYYAAKRGLRVLEIDSATPPHRHILMDHIMAKLG